MIQRRSCQAVSRSPTESLSKCLDALERVTANKLDLASRIPNVPCATPHTSNHASDTCSQLCPKNPATEIAIARARPWVQSTRSDRLCLHQARVREYFGCENGVLVETYILGRTKILKVIRPEFRQQTMATLGQSRILGVTAKAKGDMVDGWPDAVLLQKSCSWLTPAVTATNKDDPITGAAIDDSKIPTAFDIHVAQRALFSSIPTVRPHRGQRVVSHGHSRLDFHYALRCVVQQSHAEHQMQETIWSADFRVRAIGGSLFRLKEHAASPLQRTPLHPR